MTKKLLAVSFLSLMLVACGGSSGSGGSGALELSKRDKELANGNPNVAAEILVQKAILQEAKNEKLTEEEQYNLDLAKQEVEVSFYLQKKFGTELNNIQVTEDEARKYYDIHKAEIGNASYEEIKNAIVAQITYEKQTAIVNKYYEDLLSKYKIEEILKKDFPDAVQQTVEAPAPAPEATPAPAEETKTEEKK